MHLSPCTDNALYTVSVESSGEYQVMVPASPSRTVTERLNGEQGNHYEFSATINSTGSNYYAEVGPLQDVVSGETIYVS